MGHLYPSIKECSKFIGFYKLKNCRLIFFESAIFFYLNILSCCSWPEIRSESKIVFKNVPGFEETLGLCGIGHDFEIESALFIFKVLPEQHILAFNLKIGVDSVSESGDLTHLFTTEYDLCTTNFVIECKMGGWPHHAHIIEHGKKWNQFIKEQRTLQWIFWMNKKLQNQKVEISYCVEKKNLPFFKLRVWRKMGDDKIFLLTCNFINSKNIEFIERNIENLKYLINELSKKSFKVFFKSQICETCSALLKSHHIGYVDNVNLQYLSGKS